jgi:hypothetical protein
LTWNKLSTSRNEEVLGFDIFLPAETGNAKGSRLHPLASDFSATSPISARQAWSKSASIRVKACAQTSIIVIDAADFGFSGFVR